MWSLRTNGDFWELGDIAIAAAKASEAERHCGTYSTRYAVCDADYAGCSIARSRVLVDPDADDRIAGR